MIDALLQGQFPTFTYIRASSGNNVEETRVQVSSIKFSDGYKEFSDCRKNLLPPSEQDNVLPTVSTKQHRFATVSTAQNQVSQAAQNSQPLQNKTLYFNPGNIRLNDWLKNEVIAVADYMRSSPASTAVISSATAIAGKADHHVFAKRAGSIVKQLEKSGIAAGRILVKPNVSAADKGIRIDVFGPDALRLFYVSKSSAGLKAEEKQRLNILARYVLEYFKQGRLLISSHTDSSGARASNHTATQRLADVFKQYLQSRGIAADMIQIKAYGEDRPVKSNRYPEGQAQNRRILIDFVV
jgi:outer membrane protein OmpA-like peptidoglycan-associated protein